MLKRSSKKKTLYSYSSALRHAPPIGLPEDQNRVTWYNRKYWTVWAGIVL